MYGSITKEVIKDKPFMLDVELKIKYILSEILDMTQGMDNSFW